MIPVNRIYYNNIEQYIYAYKIHKNKLVTMTSHSLPSERYIYIIQGCKYRAIKDNYIEWLKSLLHVPRKRIQEFRKI